MPKATHWKSLAARNAPELGHWPALPEWSEDGVPRCFERCPYHDGKRCELLGQRPSFICEPVVAEMAKLLEARRANAGASADALASPTPHADLAAELLDTWLHGPKDRTAAWLAVAKRAHELLTKPEVV